MHELSLTRNVVSIVAERAAGRPVTAVTLRIGRLAGVSVGAVRFCFDVCIQGTSVAGAALVIEEPEGKGECPACGRVVEMDSLLECCSCEKGALLRVVGGEELLVASIEMEVE